MTVVPNRKTKLARMFEVKRPDEIDCRDRDDQVEITEASIARMLI